MGSNPTPSADRAELGGRTIDSTGIQFRPDDLATEMKLRCAVLLAIALIGVSAKLSAGTEARASSGFQARCNAQPRLGPGHKVDYLIRCNFRVTSVVLATSGKASGVRRQAVIRRNGRPDLNVRKPGLRCGFEERRGRIRCRGGKGRGLRPGATAVIRINMPRRVPRCCLQVSASIGGGRPCPESDSPCPDVAIGLEIRAKRARACWRHRTGATGAARGTFTPGP